MAAGGTSKGGYDYEFVTPPDKSLECPVCLLTLRDPHMISCCCNEFCQRCIERVQQDGKPCPLCNDPNFATLLNKKLVREVNALVVRCPQKEQGCEWEGELGQLQNHLNPGAGVSPCKGCGFVMVECAYQCGAHLQRRLLQEHKTEICPKRPIEMQVASLMQRFETIAVQFKCLTVENQQLRQELDKDKEIHKQELSQLNQQLDKVKQENQLELNQLKQELSDVKKWKEFHLTAHKEINKTCDELKMGQNAVRTDTDEQKAMQKSKFDGLETKCTSLQTNTVPLPVPPYYFSFRNVNWYQSNDLKYSSEPFYSHPGGYKMSVFVYPNGRNSKGTHMSVFVAICRGEFDDKLRWPFDGSITVQMYNCTTEQWSNEGTIVMNRNECGLRYVKRPVDVLTYGSWGYNDFLPISELKSDYVKDTGTVRFRITKVEIRN